MDKKEKFDLISGACSVHDSPETIKNLFGKDFGIDEQDEDGKTPLMYSAMWGECLRDEISIRKRC